MLIKRIITAVILIPLVILGVFYLPHVYFGLIAAMVLSLAAWEWSRLAGLTIVWQRILYVGLLWWGFAIAQLLPDMAILGINFMWWLFALYLVLRYPGIRESIGSRRFLLCTMGFLVFVPCLKGLIFLRKSAAGYVLFVLCIVWAADIGAYFVGRKWGKRKLAPQVSPGKTIEGLIGGLCFALIVAVIFGLITRIEFGKWLLWAILAVIATLFSVLGDLFVSVLKRLAGVKDSGRWLPGHGGILDRIDSLTAAIPVFALGLLIFARYL